VRELGHSEEQTGAFVDLVARHQYVFSMGEFELGQTHVVGHTIDTGGARPIKQHPRHVPPHQQKFVDDTIKELLDRNLIQESESPWSAPIVLDRKHDGSFCLCVDYRWLNYCSVKSSQPLPRIDETLNKLSGLRFFSSLDCASGYWWAWHLKTEPRPHL
jgi:hypothetical protein